VGASMSDTAFEVLEGAIKEIPDALLARVAPARAGAVPREC
jgi:hypothetical protein